MLDAEYRTPEEAALIRHVSAAVTQLHQAVLLAGSIDGLLSPYSFLLEAESQLAEAARLLGVKP